MIGFKSPRSLERPLPRRSHCAAVSVFAALTLISTESQAENTPDNERQLSNNAAAQSESMESRTFDKNPNSHTIKLDNTKGTHTLVLREKFLSPQCISGVGANFSSLPPGSIGEIHVTEDDGILSGCRSMFEDKHVTLQFDAIRTGTPALRYQIQFGVQDAQEVHGKVEIAKRHIRILSSDFGKPGTPYDATCGRLACLNEWALDYNDKRAVIYLFDNAAPNAQESKVAGSPVNRRTNPR